jgi:brefeldin A-inhibited guanine nucleotide-exchange protein
MSIQEWEKVCATFVHLFKVTTPSGLFLDSKSSPNYSDDVAGKAAIQKKDFHLIIVKCVLHLLVMETLMQTLQLERVYQAISSSHIFSLIDCLENSYQFALTFNGNTELRTRLFKMGFMKQMPNLLKQGMNEY